jgi:hypothetical protein
VLINQILGIVVRKFARFERDSSQTDFNISIAKKLGFVRDYTSTHRPSSSTRLLSLSSST